MNGLPAKVLSTDGGAPFNFQALVNLDAGANSVVVQATDGNNNTSTKTYSVTTSGTTQTFEYDGNGNLRFQRQPDGTTIREYQWDQLNRLVKSTVGTHESDYAYDGESRRVSITQKESGTQTSQEMYVWCGQRICQKRNGATVERNYFEQGFQETGADDYFYTRDHLGSVREVVGSDGLTIGSRLSYDPWGKLSESGSALSDFGFTGHNYDRATGLDLTKYREYDPVLGRWLSEDPIGFKGGMNFYAYAAGDPENRVDADGEFTPPTPGNIGCLIQYEQCIRGKDIERLNRSNPDDNGEPSMCFSVDETGEDPRKIEDERDCFNCHANCLVNSTFFTTKWPDYEWCNP